MNKQSHRYNAHLRLNDFDENSQKLIEDSSILIIGMGGIGTIASLYLVNSGVGKIILCDYDTVDISNLPRQILFQEDNVNQNKAIVAKEKLHHFNPNVLIESIDKKLNDLIISHSPNRKISGSLHEETGVGFIEGKGTVYRKLLNQDMKLSQAEKIIDLQVRAIVILLYSLFIFSAHFLPLNFFPFLVTHLE